MAHGNIDQLIPGPVTLLDCFVFCCFLAPALVWKGGLFKTIIVVLEAVPFLLFTLPLQLVRERRKKAKSPFVPTPSLFEDIVVRCVRYAFAYIPREVTLVFLHKWVAVPWMVFRKIRHGQFWGSYQRKSSDRADTKGFWMARDLTAKHDVVVYYVHGGGFSMGSPHFYMEFLAALLSLLAERGFENPAVFALEYTLVPDAYYPTQIGQVERGYDAVVAAAGSPRRVCVCGDSAGANLLLAWLLRKNTERTGQPTPGLAVLMSPWVTVVSPRQTNTSGDYIDARRLDRWGMEYAGREPTDSPYVSPGSCKDPSRWERCSPVGGFHVTYGAQEVMAGEIEGLMRVWEQAGIPFVARRLPHGIHAWPVVSMFLSDDTVGRLEGADAIAAHVRERFDTLGLGLGPNGNLSD